MKKVLLVTKISRNYGALLQAYALNTTLQQMGAEVQTLNLNFSQTVKSYEQLPKITGFHTLLRFLRELRVYSDKKEAIARSLRFREENLNLTEPYPSYEAVAKVPPQAEVYITGSDQVWNPNNNYDKSYYLLFGQPETIRASYAASIAIEKIPEQLQEDFPKRVRNMDFISVREESGKALLAQYGIEAQVHLDPTLLLEREDYEKLLVKPKLTEPYVLFYFIRMPDNREKIVERMRLLYPGRKLVLVVGGTQAIRLGDIQILNAGPREFLGLVRDADAVVTTSFHGTVFSGIFGKDFAVFVPPKVGGRITNLLKIADMEKHIVSEASQINESVLHQEGNMLQAPQLKQKRMESLDYLRTVLKAAGQ